MESKCWSVGDIVEDTDGDDSGLYIITNLNYFTNDGNHHIAYRVVYLDDFVVRTYTECDMHCDDLWIAYNGN